MELPEIAAKLAVDDIVVFGRRDDELLLCGGIGRGAGWAGVVQTTLSAEPLAARAIDEGVTVRRAESRPQRVVGPYWASAFALVPVGGDHVVVFGGEHPIAASGGELLRFAVEAVSATQEVSPSKLLADELEVVHAVRRLMSYQPTSVSETALHVATVAAEVLSCDLAAVLVRRGTHPVVEAAGLDWSGCDAEPELCAWLEQVSDELQADELLEQELPQPPDPLARMGSLISRYTLRIGDSAPLGVLVAGHAVSSPRGFTNLCQRVGRTLADAAEVLLVQAIAREELTAERDRLAVQARTDAVTGLANRTAWQEVFDREAARWERHPRPQAVIMVDVDDLKLVNDRHGHAAGDEILRGVAEVLVSCLRDADMVARVGGDEFAALLPDAEPSSVPAVIERIRAACAEWSGEHPERELRVSVGWGAPGADGDLRSALRVADERLYAAKRAVRRSA